MFSKKCDWPKSYSCLFVQIMFHFYFLGRPFRSNAILKMELNNNYTIAEYSVPQKMETTVVKLSKQSIFMLHYFICSAPWLRGEERRELSAILENIYR